MEIWEEMDKMFKLYQKCLYTQAYVNENVLAKEKGLLKENPMWAHGEFY